MRVLLHVRSEEDDAEREDADLLVSKRLVEREDEVYRTFGDAGAVMRLRNEREEEEEIRDAFLAGRDVEEVVALPADADDDFDLFLANLSGRTPDPSTPTGSSDGLSVRPGLFPDTKSFAETAFDEVYEEDPYGEIGFAYDEHEPDLLTFRPAPDLQRRLRVLPEEYLKDHEVLTNCGPPSRPGSPRTGWRSPASVPRAVGWSRSSHWTWRFEAREGPRTRSGSGQAAAGRLVGLARRPPSCRISIP